MNQQLKDYCDRAYENSCAHGFHDEDDLYKDVPYLAHALELAAIARMHEEVFEMVQALNDHPCEPSEKIPGFQYVEEEAADLAIRVFDWCVYKGYAIWDLKLNLQMYPDIEATPRADLYNGCASLHAVLGEITHTLRRQEQSPGVTFLFSVVITSLRRMFPATLLGAIDAKMEYNKSRPYKHGKKS